jgi:hypothetical protein
VPLVAHLRLQQHHVVARVGTELRPAAAEEDLGVGGGEQRDPRRRFDVQVFGQRGEVAAVGAERRQPDVDRVHRLGRVTRSQV